MAKNLFRKNRDLEAEAICKECEVDEAYDRIRELEETLAEKDVIIDEIILQAEEASDDWANALKEAERKQDALRDQATEISQMFFDEQYKVRSFEDEKAYIKSVLSLIPYERTELLKEIWGVFEDEASIALILDCENREVEDEIKFLDLKEDLENSYGYIVDEFSDLQSTMRVRRTLEELEDGVF